jgi:hypothetical protein
LVDAFEFKEAAVASLTEIASGTSVEMKVNTLNFLFHFR